MTPNPHSYLNIQLPIVVLTLYIINIHMISHSIIQSLACIDINKVRYIYTMNSIEACLMRVIIICIESGDGLSIDIL